MSAINTINLPIDEKAHSYAKIYSALLSEEYQRKRAYASILSLFAFVNIIEKESVNIQKSMTLFRNPILNEQYEIADLYVNNWHLDVRVVNATDAVLVPKVHYESGIVPDFYVVVKIDKDLKNAELIGFVDTSKDVKEAFDYHYFKIPFTSLIGYDEFLNKVQTIKQEKHTQKDYELFQNSYLSLMDGGLDEPTKNEVLKHLFKCSECRTEFCCFTGFEMVSCNINKYPEVLDDKTLDIIGAQSAYDAKYEGKEETIYIGEESTSEVVEQNLQQDGVDDILDELFDDEETQTVQEPSSDIQNNTETDINIIEAEEDISSTIDADKDIEIIEEDSNFVDLQSGNADDEVELLEEDNNSKYNDMDIIGENTVEQLEDESDFVVINEDDSDTSELELEDKNPDTVQEEVQKVIVDYDETGEPIYSYITNVDQEENSSVLSEAEPTEEDEDKVINNEEEISDIYPDDDVQQTSADIENVEEETVTDNGDFIEAETPIQLENDEIENKDEDDMLKSPQEEHPEYFNVAPQKDLYEEEISENSQIEDEESAEDNVSDIEDAQDIEEETQEDEEGDEKEYDEEEVYENYEGNDVKRPNKTSFIMLSLLIAIVLLGGGVFFAFKGINKSNTASVPVENIVPPDEQTTNDMFEQPVEQEDALEIPSDTEKSVDNQENSELNASDMFSSENPIPNQGTIPVPPPAVQQPAASNGDVNKVMANAFNQSASGIFLKGLNWFCTAELFSDPTFKNYLQNIDNSLKQNIKNNIMGVMQAPPNDSVAAKFAVDNNGNLQRVIISDSSGSEQIDNIVLQSIKESFQGPKSQILNDSTLKSDMYYLKVVIKL